MLSRAIVPLRRHVWTSSSSLPSSSLSLLPIKSSQSLLQSTSFPVISTRQQVRYGSMKVKRIQKRQPLEKNRIKRLIKGTKLEVKRGKKKKKYHGNEDPNAYIDVKPVEFDPYDLRGRTTLKVLQKPTLNLYIL